MWYEMVEQLLQQLLTLLRADTSYFASRAPVIKEIATILLAVGWALLIGNLAYQALRSMVSGVGIEAEDPTRLFLRTAMFSFLLVCARQICNIGLSLTAVIMRLLQMPGAVSFTPFNEDFFSSLPNAGWLVVIVVNVYVQWQIIKLFFEVAERYVILCTLVYCAPLAFAMGGSKSTAEIFRGWLRMFASMCTLTALNVVFVKLLLSAMSNSPTGAAIVPWVMLITGIVRVAKKLDSIVLRIGLNPASTGDPLGHHHIPGMLSAMMFHHAAAFIKNTIASSPPHATGTMQPRYFDPLAYGMDRQVTTGRVAEIGAPSGASTQTASAEYNSDAESTVNVSRSAGTMQPRTAASHAPHQYADINIEADDFIDGESISQAGSTVTAFSSRISPVAPHIQPLPHNFAETKPPLSPQTVRPPITPQAQHTNNTTQIAQNVPQNIVQNANAQNIAESQLAEHSMEQTSTLQPQTIEHSTQTENNSGTHGQQAGRISPVTPPKPARTREAAKTEYKHTELEHSSTQIQSVNDQKTVNHVQPPTSAKAAPIMPNVSQNRHTESTRVSAPQNAANEPDRTVTPAAAQKAVSPTKPNIIVQRTPLQGVQPNATAQSTPQAVKLSAESQRTPTQAVKPDITPQRNRGISAAVRPDISPVSAQNSAVKPQQNRRKSPNPVSPVSPVPQPHTLRRTAEPVKRKDITPRNGGDRNARRKRKP